MLGRRRRRRANIETALGAHIFESALGDDFVCGFGICGYVRVAQGTYYNAPCPVIRLLPVVRCSTSSVVSTKPDVSVLHTKYCYRCILERGAHNQYHGVNKRQTPWFDLLLIHGYSIKTQRASPWRLRTACERVREPHRDLNLENNFSPTHPHTQQKWSPHSIYWYIFS